MSDKPSDLPPPYPGLEGYGPNNYNTFGQPPAAGFAPPPAAGFAPPPAAGFAPPPQPYDPQKHGGSYPTQTYGAPPPAPYQAAQPGYLQTHTHGTTVVVTQPAVSVIQTYRESPVRTRCIHCAADVITAVHYETGTFAWVVCCVLCLVGSTFCCCLIPFCLDGCKDVIHTCPNCHQQMARFNRM